MEQRVCLTCGEKLKGRIDKKFCDDQCRTSYNNRLNSDSAAIIKRINNILKKNRRVLEELLVDAPEGKIKVSKKKLLDKGFNFSYQTHIYKTKTGTVYYFSYEYGYLPLENEYYMIVKRQGE